jgi:hypothetical protein
MAMPHRDDLLIDAKSTGELNAAERERLDDLLASARSFHYAAFALSGLSLALSSMDATAGFQLPIGDIVVPQLQTTVGIYMLVLVLIMASDRLSSMAIPWLKLDSRRVPFAWIALGLREPSGRSATFWLILPVFLCATSTAIALEVEDITGVLLSFVGVMLVMIPREVGDNWYLIRKRLDHRGGAATFSMWLLYWSRLVRGVTFTLWIFAPVAAVVPEWRPRVWRIAYPALIIGGVAQVLRLLGYSPLAYRWIDSVGERLGFPTKSIHYD